MLISTKLLPGSSCFTSHAPPTLPSSPVHPVSPAHLASLTPSAPPTLSAPPASPVPPTLPIHSTRAIRVEILQLSIPASLEVVFQMLLGVVDMLFVGRLGSYALAGVALTNQIVTLLLLIYGTIGIGASILISQYYGKGEHETVSVAAGQTLIFATLVGLLSLVVLLPFATLLLQLVGAEPRVVVLGAPFFRVIAFSMPLSLLCSVAGAILRSLGNTRIPFVITAITVVVNTLLNYVLIFGVNSTSFGVLLPAFGVIGAAYATLLARAVGVVLIFYYLFFLHKIVVFKIAHIFALCVTRLWQVIKLSSTVALSAFIWTSGTFIYLVIFTRLGTDQLVASQIIATIENFFIMFSFGISVSGLTLVAQAIGAGEFQLMQQKTREILRLGLIAASIFGLLMLLTSWLLHLMYPDVTAQAHDLARWGLIFYAIFQPVKVTNMIMGAGILRGGGLTKFVAMVDILDAFIIGLPIAYLLGFHFHMGFQGVLIGRVCEEVSRVIIFIVRYRKPQWYRVLTTTSSSN